MNNLLEKALAYRKAGRDVIPDHPTEKYPVGFSNWQTKKFTEAELADCITKKGYGIGIRNQEGLDFDNHGNREAEKILKDWKKLVETICTGLIDRLLIEKTQHGGFHICWLCKTIEENQKLASRPPTEEELKKEPKTKSVTFIETRGTGGQFVVSPTPGYSILQGDWCNLQQITPEEREVLLHCARSLNLMPTSTEDFRTPTDNFDGDRPGDIFNRHGSMEALELLTKTGWQVVFEKNGVSYLRRPGKDKGISATFGYIAPEIFYNFSSNSEPFDQEKAYTPFAIFTILKHGGNFSEAASELAKRYGISKTKESDLTAHFTDTSNAEKIKELFKDKIRFDHRRKRWLIWQDHRWQPDTDGSIYRFAIETARKRYLEAVDIKDEDKRKAVASWAIKSESKTRLDSAIGIVKNLLPIADSGDN